MKIEDKERSNFNIEKFVPGANMELIIEGLVLFYESRGRLKMRFPDADYHETKIEITSKTDNRAIASIPVPPELMLILAIPTRRKCAQIIEKF